MTRISTLAIATMFAAAGILPAAAQTQSKSNRVIASDPAAMTAEEMRAARAQARDSMAYGYQDGLNAYGGAYIGDGVDGPLYAPYAPGFPGACLTDEGYGRYYSCDGGQ
ncbi:MAG: hypothetical protein HXY30_08825 [Pseudorhodoplanes sp.]|nr:hypothetical protein [Pseudorhodoplanes sp.]